MQLKGTSFVPFFLSRKAGAMSKRALVEVVEQLLGQPGLATWAYCYFGGEYLVELLHEFAARPARARRGGDLRTYLSDEAGVGFPDGMDEATDIPDEIMEWYESQVS